MLQPEEHHLAGRMTAHYGCDSLEDLFKPLPPKSEKVVLTYDYIAEVWAGDDKIVINCLSIPITKIREVMALWDKLNPKNDAAVLANP